LEGPPLNNQNIATFSAEDQEINSAGWNWAGVASIWGVARTEGKKNLQNWWSLRLEGFQQAFHLYPKDIKHAVG